MGAARGNATPQRPFFSSRFSSPNRPEGADLKVSLFILSTLRENSHTVTYLILVSNTVVTSLSARSAFFFEFCVVL